MRSPLELLVLERKGQGFVEEDSILVQLAVVLVGSAEARLKFEEGEVEVGIG